MRAPLLNTRRRLSRFIAAATDDEVLECGEKRSAAPLSQRRGCAAPTLFASERKIEDKSAIASPAVAGSLLAHSKAASSPKTQRWVRLPLAFIAVLIVMNTAVRWTPFPDHLLREFPASVVIADREGRPLRVRLGPGDIDCRPGYLPAPDDWIALAIVASEDRRFWSHRGVDPIAILRALKQNIRAGRRHSGASTISTQVIRLIEPRPRTLRTKLIEAFRALQLERRYSKTEILAHYLNRAPFGGNIVGIEAAADRYFGKQPAELSLAEAALLAGLPQAPSRYRPDRHPDRAAQRQAYVLNRLLADNHIDHDAAAAARAQPIAVRPATYPFNAPHFADWLGVPGRAGLAGPIHTTLDLELQRLAEETLRRHIAGRSVRGGAIVILDVQSGALRAMVGSPDYSAPHAGQVNAALSPRAAGSTLKPFAYALALDRGLMTPQTVLTDVPARFRDYDPTNFDATFRGLVSFRDALVLSLNLPSLEVQRRIGQPTLHQTLRALGLTTLMRPPDHYGTGLILGNAEVRLLELANAYACLARNGDYLPVRVLESVPVPAPRRVFSAEAAWLIADLLSGEERAMDTTGHAADVRLPAMAWKTGTSAGLRDAWTVAYNPDHVIGVWVGNPDGAASDELIGREAATPIAWDLFRQLHPDNRGPWYARPAGVKERTVCALSGRPAGSRCGVCVQDWYIERVTLHEACPAHRPGAGSVRPREIALRERAARLVETIRISTPARGSVFRFTTALAAEAQRIPLLAIGDRSGGELFWFINDRPLGTSRPGVPLFWPIEPGTHQIVCSTTHGVYDRIQITVE